MKRIIAILLVLLVTLLVACQKKDYPDPKPKFYVNDYADALMTYTENEIVAYNRYLYETYGEVQIVYATFLVESAEEMADYDKTDLFRQWKIGKNDMGLLVLLFFEETSVDVTLSTTLVGYAFEVGYRLEPYLPAGFLGETASETLLSDAHSDISDLMVVHLNFELLNKLYVDLYEETAIAYDIDDFYNELIHAPYVPDEENQSNLWFLSSLFDGSKTSIIFIIAFAFLGGGFGVVRLRGGGGSSGGAGLFKRRR